jgi:hypothetical protein
MEWYVYVARFFAGAFLANALPHLVSGLQGRPFPSPFSTPPGKGESSPTVNVIWGAANAMVGYLLLYHVGDFAMTRSVDVGIAGLGALVMSVMLARAFGEVYGASNKRG